VTATETLVVYKLPRSGKIAAQHAQVGGGAASFGSIKITIVSGIRKTALRSKWIK
jgi:hypothetical protein